MFGRCTVISMNSTTMWTRREKFGIKEKDKNQGDQINSKQTRKNPKKYQKIPWNTRKPNNAGFDLIDI